MDIEAGGDGVWEVAGDSRGDEATAGHAGRGTEEDDAEAGVDGIREVAGDSR